MKVVVILAFVILQLIGADAQVNNNYPVSFGVGQAYEQYTPVVGPAYTVYQLPYGIDFYGTALVGPNVPLGHGLFYTTHTPCGTGQSCDYASMTQQIIDLDLSNMEINSLVDMNMETVGYFTPENDNIQDGTYSYFLTRGKNDGQWYFNKWSTSQQRLILSRNIFYAEQMALDLFRNVAYILGNDGYGFSLRKFDLNTMTQLPFVNSSFWNGYNTTTITRMAFDVENNQLYTVAFPITGYADLIRIDGQSGKMVGSPTPLYVSPQNEIFFMEINNGNIYVAYSLVRGNSWDDVVASQASTLISREMMGSKENIVTFEMGMIGAYAFVGSNLYLGSKGGELLKFNVGSNLVLQDRMLLQSHMAIPPSCDAISSAGPIISTMAVSPSDPNTMYITGTWWSLIIVVHLDRFSSVVPCMAGNSLPIWAIILISLGSIALLTVLIVLSVRAIRRRRHHHHLHHEHQHFIQHEHMPLYQQPQQLLYQQPPVVATYH